MLSVKNIKRTAMAMIAALGILIGSTAFVEARSVAIYEEDPYTGETVIAGYDDHDDYYYYSPPKRHYKRHNNDDEFILIWGRS